MVSMYLYWLAMETLISFTADSMGTNTRGYDRLLCYFMWIGTHSLHSGSRHDDDLQNCTIVWPWWNAHGVFIFPLLLNV